MEIVYKTKKENPKKPKNILVFCTAKTSKCGKVDFDEKTQTLCVCDKELCNSEECKMEKVKGNWTCKKESEKESKNGAGTSYTHLIIAFIVGAIFFH